MLEYWYTGGEAWPHLLMDAVVLRLRLLSEHLIGTSSELTKRNDIRIAYEMFSFMKCWEEVNVN